MTGRNEEAPPGRHSGRGNNSNYQESSWHTHAPSQPNLSPGALRARRLIIRAADARHLFSVTDLARAAAVSERTARLWLIELDATPEAWIDAVVDTYARPTSAARTSPRYPGSPRGVQ